MPQLPTGQAIDARGGYTHTIVEDNGPVTAAQFEAGLAMLADRVAKLCEQKDAEMRVAIEAGVKRGIEQAMSDQELTKRFWRTGFDELTTHGSNHASQWVGRRLLTIIVVAVLAGCITWLARTGQIK